MAASSRSAAGRGGVARGFASRRRAVGAACSRWTGRDPVASAVRSSSIRSASRFSAQVAGQLGVGPGRRVSPCPAPAPGRWPRARWHRGSRTPARDHHCRQDQHDGHRPGPARRWHPRPADRRHLRTPPPESIPVMTGEHSPGRPSRSRLKARPGGPAQPRLVGAGPVAQHGPVWQPHRHAAGAPVPVLPMAEATALARRRWPGSGTARPRRPRGDGPVARLTAPAPANPEGQH
jgi:hypothetical protein